MKPEELATKAVSEYKDALALWVRGMAAFHLGDQSDYKTYEGWLNIEKERHAPLAYVINKGDKSEKGIYNAFVEYYRTVAPKPAPQPEVIRTGPPTAGPGEKLVPTPFGVTVVKVADRKMGDLTVDEFRTILRDALDEFI